MMSRPRTLSRRARLISSASLTMSASSPTRSAGSSRPRVPRAESAGSYGDADDPKVDRQLLILTIVLLVFLGGADGVVLGWGMNRAAQWAFDAPQLDRT